jgi:hypothetical protein
MFRRMLLSTVLPVLFASGLQSAVYIVPDDSPTIQAAINEAVSGDTIYVRPGVYHENLVITSKGLYMSSIYEEPGLENMRETIIDGTQSGAVISASFCPDTVTIKGFTICNGYSQSGGGIRCLTSVMKLEDLVVRDNATWMGTWSHGGGIAVFTDSYAKMKNLLVTGNKSYDYGGGISARSRSIIEAEGVIIRGNTAGGGGHGKGGGLQVDYESRGYFYRCEITNNIASKWGGGLYASDAGFISLVNVSITDNFAGYGGGAIYTCYSGSRIFLGNSIVYGNKASFDWPGYQQVYFDDTGSDNILAYICSDIQGGSGNFYIPPYLQAIDLEGNVDCLPYFNPGNSLSNSSPCIDGGVSSFYYWNQHLIDIPASEYFGEAPDMGAYENFNILLGTEEQPEPAQEWLSVYPNPAAEKLNISIADPGLKKVTVTLYGITGEMIIERRFQCSRAGTSRLALDLTGLAQGIYLLKAEARGREAAVKVVH